MFKIFKYLKAKEWLTVAVAASLIVAQVGLEINLADHMRDISYILNGSSSADTR